MATIRVQLDVANLRRQIAQVNQDLQNLGRQTGLQNVDQGLNRTQQTAQRTGLAIGNLRTIIATLVTGAITRQIVQFADTFTLLENRITAVIPEGASASVAIEQLARVSRDAGVSLEAVSSTFARFAFATEGLGLSQSQLVGIVETLNRGLVVYGATAQEASSVSLQLAQGLASGRLAGEEFRAITEGFPPLLRAIAEELGVTTGELKELAAEGAIGPEVIIAALQDLQTEIEQVSQETERTLGQAFAALVTSSIQFVAAADDATDTSSNLAAAIDDAADFVAELSEEVALAGDLSPVFAAGLRLIDVALQEAASDAADFVDRLTEIRLVGPIIEFLRDRFVDVNEAVSETSDGSSLLSTTLSQLGGGLNDLIDEADEFARNLLGVDGAAEEAAVSLQTLAGLGGGVAQLLAAAGQESGDAAADFEALARRAALLDTELGRLSGGAGDYAQAAEDIAVSNQRAAEEVAALEEQGEDLADTFRILASSGRDAALAANEFEAGLERLDGIFEEFERETEALNTTFEGLADTLGDVFGTSGQDIEAFFNNAQTLLNNLGIEWNVAFRNIAQAVADAMGVSIEQLDGFFGLAVRGLELFGIEFEDLFGRRLTGIIQTFASLSENELSALSDILGGIFTGAGGLGDSIGGVFEGLGTVVTDFAGSLLGIGDAAATTSRVGIETLGGLGGAVEDLTNAAGGATQSFATTATQFTALAGIGVGAITTLQDVVASFVTDPIDLELQQSRALFREIRDGAVITAQTIRDEFGPRSAEILARLNDQFLTLSNAIAGVGDTAEIIGDDSAVILGALSNVAEVTAGRIAEVFQVSAADVSAVISTLPEEFFQSFNALDENSRAVAEELSRVFGVSVEEILAILGQLSTEAQERINGITDAGQFTALALQDAFGISADVILGIFDTLPEGSTSSFAAIQENAELIARNLAVTFGVSADEILAILRGIATDGQASFNDLAAAGRDAFTEITGISGDAFAQILADAGVAEDQITSIFQEIGAGGIEAFQELTQQAGGSVDQITAAFQAAGGNIGGILAGIEANGNSAFGNIANAGQGSANDIAGAFASAGGQAGGALQQIAGAASSAFGSAAGSAASAAGSIQAAFAAAARNASGSIAGIRQAAGAAAAAVRSIPALPSRQLATGGIITGPVSLSSSQSFGQSGFRSGGLLPGLTGIGGGNIAGPFSAVAGEAGPEAILPLTQTSDGLGVTARVSGGGGGVQVFIIEGVDREVTDRLRQQLINLDASVDFRSSLAAERLLLGQF